MTTMLGPKFPNVIEQVGSPSDGHGELSRKKKASKVNDDTEPLSDQQGRGAQSTSH